MGISGISEELSSSQKLCWMELVMSSHAATFPTLLRLWRWRQYNHSKCW